MAGIDQQRFARTALADMDGLVLTRRGDAHAIRRPGNGCDHARVAAIREEMLAGLCIPDLRRVIGTAGDNTPTIRRPGDREHRWQRALRAGSCVISRFQAASLPFFSAVLAHLPYLQGFLIAPNSQPLAV